MSKENTINPEVARVSIVKFLDWYESKENRMFLNRYPEERDRLFPALRQLNKAFLERDFSFFTNGEKILFPTTK